MIRLPLATVTLALSSAAAAQTSGTPADNWTITNQSSPLNGARTMAASVESANQLANMLGNAQRASLIIRCGEDGLAVYVNWPQVVSYDGQNVMGQPKTIAVWRIDEGKIQSNLWDISSTGTAAGEFKSKNALKLLSGFVGARKLAVRLTGRQTQDAEFDLAGVDQVAAESASACGLTLRK